MSSPVVSYPGEVEGSAIGTRGRAKLSRREPGQHQHPTNVSNNAC